MFLRNYEPCYDAKVHTKIYEIDLSVSCFTHNLYASPNIIKVNKSRRIRCVEHVARMEKKRSAYNILVGKPEGKTPLGIPRSRW
jgi:hypothetical protein